MHTSEKQMNILRSSGLKATEQRLAILGVLLNEKHPVTVSMIAKKLTSVNQITVYRALEIMVLKGLVRKVDTQNPYTHYELLATRRHHHHITCIHCGLIEDVEICLPNSVVIDALRQARNFSSIADHSLEFTGTCAHCLKK